MRSVVEECVEVRQEETLLRLPKADVVSQDAPVEKNVFEVRSGTADLLSARVVQIVRSAQKLFNVDAAVQPKGASHRTRHLVIIEFRCGKSL